LYVWAGTDRIGSASALAVARAWLAGELRCGELCEFDVGGREPEKCTGVVLRPPSGCSLRGRSTMNVVPTPTRERTRRRPPLSCTICRTMARPRPVPLPPDEQPINSYSPLLKQAATHPANGPARSAKRTRRACFRSYPFDGYRIRCRSPRCAQ
jgi:hypothetical protein